jgi:putative drug exporter of the RND superfamily
MYHRLGETVSRHPWPILIAWAGLLAALLTWGPRPQAISRDGVFSFLPPDSPSLAAERMFREAFPSEGDGSDEATQQDPLGSNIVIVIRREDQRTGLTDADRDFVHDVLKPRLEEIRLTTPAGRQTDTSNIEFKELPVSERRVRSIWTSAHPRMGPLLNSGDGHSTLVVMELNGEFLDYGNKLAIARIEELLRSQELQKRIPPGLDLAISGSAAVGRDMLEAEQQSGSSTDLWTKLLVVFLLLAIYRAPIVALLPLITVGVAVAVSVRLLALMAKLEWIGFFAGMQVYVTVVAYGAGVDYCLFLIARFREQLEHGATFEEAVSHAVRFVGVALTASAGASILGISMMMFAEFGKFQQAGFAISFGLFVVLLCALTMTPAMLRLVARVAFWPDVRKEHPTSKESWIPAPGLIESIREKRWFEKGWESVANVLSARPGTVFAVSLLVMLPFAVIGIVFHAYLSYGLLSDIPQTSPSVVGARAIQEHFPAGISGVATILLKNDKFRRQDEINKEGKIDLNLQGLNDREKVVRGIVERIGGVTNETPDGEWPRFKSLGLEDVRSQRMPLGVMQHAGGKIKPLRPGERILARNMAQRAYASMTGPHAGTVLRIDLVFNTDPFARDSVAKLTRAEQAVKDAIPQAIKDAIEDASPDRYEAETKVYTLGPTAGIRDLKSTTDRDQIRIDILVSLAVYLVLIALLRQPMVSLYLIVSVVISYFVTMGVTFVVFWALNPATFAGLDWKVPVFTFTLLIALGEDYNILLMARVTEEQRKHGLVKGVLVALTKTGGIISSCGIIMAGTFCSLMFGSLVGMVQLGFAVAFGVLLDTFLVRPVLVPAYLLLLYRSKGRLGRWLGRPDHLPEHTPLADAIADADDDIAEGRQ